MYSRFLAAGLLLGCVGCFDGLLIKPVNTQAPLAEKTVRPAEHALTFNKIAVIDVGGMLLNMNAGSLLSSGSNPVSDFREKLQRAAEDSSVKAVVLRINSPGGGVTASDIMWHDLMEFRKTTSKPVVACLLDMATSGGYYVAVASDRLIAHPTCVTGSIGVVMTMWNFHHLLDKIGVENRAITSGPNKAMGSPSHALSDEQEAILQGVIDQFHSRFVEIVAKGRPKLDIDTIRILADGRIYSATEAKSVGLVDRIGYLEDAFEEAISLAKIDDAQVVMYAPAAESRPSIYSTFQNLPKEINLFKVNLPGLESGPAFLYLWQPGLAKAFP